MTEQSQSKKQWGAWRKWFGRIALFATVLVTGLVLVIFLAGRWTRSNLIEQFPPPGELVDVGGFSLHMNCMGEGSPTVIMQSGLSDFSVQWALVQPDVARFSRVCVYDRAGLGWSEPGLLPRTSETIVAELHTLLVNGGVEAPYLLVGHSYGGLNMRLYAERYPEEVVGLVLVDAVHPEQEVRIPAYQEARAKISRIFRWLALLREMGIVSLFSEGVPNPGFPAEAFAQYAAILATTRFFENSNAEAAVFTSNLSEIRAANLDDLGDLPLIVISRGLEVPVPGATATENMQIELEWQQMQRELTALSTNSRQIIAESSGHNIALQQPKLVVEAIRELAEAINATTQPASLPEEVTIPSALHSSKSPAGAPSTTHSPEPTSTLSPTPEPTLTPTMTPTPVQVEFTLRTAYKDGQFLYIGVGGEIDGVINPDLLVTPGTVVKATLVIGDGMAHDLYFPDFGAQSDLISRVDQTSEITFTVDAEAGAYPYYCTVPGHRQSGQEGRLIVTEEGAK